MYWHLLNLENYSYKPTWIKTWTKLYPDYSTAHKNIWVQIFKLPFKTVRETLSYKRIFGVKTRKHLEIIWRGINAILDQSIAGEGGMSPNYAPCGVLKSYCKGMTMSHFLGQIIWRGVNTISHQSINAEWWYGTLMWWPRSLLKKSDLDLFLAGSKINFTALLSLAWDKHRSRPVSWLWDKHRSTPVSWLWDRCETNIEVHLYPDCETNIEVHLYPDCETNIEVHLYPDCETNIEVYLYPDCETNIEVHLYPDYETGVRQTSLYMVQGGQMHLLFWYCVDLLSIYTLQHVNISDSYQLQNY